MFKAVERLQFLTRVELLLFLIYSFRALWFVMSAFVSIMEHSTIVEGQRLGTVHIMEGTCSRLRFFVRNEHTMTPRCTGTPPCTYTYRYMYMCVYVCVFFFVWCRVMSCVARRCWLGSHCVVIENRMKKKEQERNGAKVAEQIV